MGRTHYLMVERRQDRVFSIEAEPLVVDTDRPGEIVLELDSGECLIVDAVELRAAIRPVRAAA